MSEQVPVLLLTDRSDLADAFLGDPGSTRYALERAAPSDASLDWIAQTYPIVIFDFRCIDDGPGMVKALKGTNDALEILCVVDAPSERTGVEALRFGAFDYQIWPVREEAALWQMLSRCLAQIAPPAPSTPQEIGGFEVLRRLGAGGMAEVFLACDAEGNQVVVKVMHSHMAAQAKFQDMFMDEARISAQLDHPNVVRVLDFGRTADERLFIVMEYVHGWNLQQLGVLCEWDIPPHIALFLVAEVCAGLQYAHTATDAEGRALDIVHRDINPPNILVREDGWVKITDFGIAKAKDRYSETTVGALKGKLSFMSPEQVEPAARIDSRADVFAAGIVLYQLLTQRHPFDAPTPFDMMVRIREGDVEPIGSSGPRIPEAVAEIAMRALAAAPKDRYQTAAEMEVVLRAQLGQAGIESCSRADLSEWAAIVGHGLWRREGDPPPVERMDVAQSPTAISGTFFDTPLPSTGDVRVVGGATVVPMDTEATRIRQQVGVSAPDRADADATQPPADQHETQPPDRERGVEPEEETVWQDDVPSQHGTRVTPVAVGVSAPPPADPAVQPASPPLATGSDGPLFPATKRRSSAQRWLRYALGGVGFVALVGMGAVVGRVILEPPAGPSDPVPGATGRVSRATPPKTKPSAKARSTPHTVARSTPRKIATPRPTPASRPTPKPTPKPTVQKTVTPRPAVRNGTLSIMVAGWASVTIDGRHRGNAPVAGLVLPAGRHEVVLENSQLGTQRTYTVVIQANKETRLRAQLR